LETVLRYSIRDVFALFAILIIAISRAHAQSAGSLIVSAGGAWVDASLSHSEETHSQSAFGSFTSPGTNAEVHNSFSAQFLITYFVSDHVAMELPLGVPPTLRLFAQGNAAPFGPDGPSLPLGNIHPLATTRAWAPMLLAKYYFGNADSKLRPFVGVGVNYTWFTSGNLNSNFESPLREIAGPGGSVSSGASSSWNPVFTVGASYNMSKRWYLTGSVTYLPLKVNASFNAVNRNGDVVLSNKVRVTADPLLVFMGVGYRF
jgi:outer membrane protein